MLKNFRHVFDLSFFVRGILGFAVKDVGYTKTNTALSALSKTMLKRNHTRCTNEFSHCAPIKDYSS